MAHHQRGLLLLVVCFLRSCQVSLTIELSFDNQLVIVANGKLHGRLIELIKTAVIKYDDCAMQIALQEWPSDRNCRTWMSLPASRLAAYRNARTSARRGGILVTRLLLGTPRHVQVTRCFNCWFSFSNIATFVL